MRLQVFAKWCMKRIEPRGVSTCKLEFRITRALGTASSFFKMVGDFLFHDDVRLQMRPIR